MTRSDWRRVVAEAADAAADGASPASIAIHLEEACDVVFPDAFISTARLGSADAILATLRELGEPV
ncbi:hypothetical protein QWJ90_04175 [Microbacterium oryzae]|uniref:hypothetical protein n=1 Tax=Microbacterium oryzae TaxID=743009 RepID=UPI0025AECED9|nr:hypothetical protein [Microbacterium oryzae]MDN3310122.1 hypothetical protein [Microbacterium oryzae]